MMTAGGSRPARRGPSPTAAVAHGGGREGPAEGRRTGDGPALRVLLAGSRRLDGEALRSFLAGAGIEVQLVDGDGGLRRALAHRRPDLVLVDVRASTAAAREGAAIARRFPGVKVVGLLGSVDPALVREARRAGLRSFVTTQVPAGEFAEVLRSLVEGRVSLADGRRPFAGGRMAPAERAREDDGRAVEALTARELEVLELLVQGAGNEEIALRLGISLSTVRSHVHSLLTKLHARSRLEAAARAVRRGLVRAHHRPAVGAGRRERELA
ncbi:MAG TPA: response regulator transcription factor [Actinomycetota bacterium]|nr:response regulator transcription factor [Actinomycetota bacterium]